MQFDDTDNKALMYDAAKVQATVVGHVSLWRFSLDGNLEKIENLPSYRDCDAFACGLGRVVAFYSISGTGHLRVMDYDFNEIWEDDGAEDAIRDLLMDSDNNIYIASNESGKEIRKRDSDGDEVWSYSPNDYAKCLARDTSGNIYAGTDWNATPIIKLNSSGVKQWDNDDCNDNVIAVNDTGTCVYGRRGEQLIKLNSSGVKQWDYDTQKSHLANEPNVECLAVDSNGGIIVGTGWCAQYDETDYDTYGASYEGWEIGGEIQADAVISKYGGDILYRCLLTHTTAADNEPGVGANWETYWVVMPYKNLWKISSSGTRIWTACIKEGSYDNITHIVTDSDDNIYVAIIGVGFSAVIKLNSSGVEQWQFDINERIHDIAVIDTEDYKHFFVGSEDKLYN